MVNTTTHRHDFTNEERIAYNKYMVAKMQEYRKTDHGREMVNRNNNWRMKQLLATLIYSLSHKLSNLKQIVIKGSATVNHGTLNDYESHRLSDFKNIPKKELEHSWKIVIINILMKATVTRIREMHENEWNAWKWVKCMKMSEMHENGTIISLKGVY